VNSYDDRADLVTILPQLLVEFGDSELRRTDEDGNRIYDKRQPLLFGPTGRKYSVTDGRYNYHAASFVYNTAYRVGYEVPIYPRSSTSAIRGRSYNNTADTFHSLAQSNGESYFERFFEVIAWPGQQEPIDVRPGDLLLQGSEPETDFGQIAIIVDPTPRDMSDSFFDNRDVPSGRGAQCIEAGLLIRTREDRNGKAITDSRGVVLPSRMVVRFKETAIDFARIAYQMDSDPEYRHMLECAGWRPASVRPIQHVSAEHSVEGDNLGRTFSEDAGNANKWRKLFPDAKRTKADFLIDGSEYFESVARAIETAKSENHFIYILGWMLDIDLELTQNDRTKTLFNLLRKAADRKVEIRILVWDNLIPQYAKLHADAIPRLNKLPNTKAFIDEHTFFPTTSKQLIQQIAPYIMDLIKRYGSLLTNPAVMRFAENHDVPISYVLYRLLFLLSQQTIGAHHEKVIIVKGDEGLVAFCGGIDFNKNRVISTIDQKEYRFPYYHDTACRLEGPAAYDVLQRFKRRWRNHPAAKKVSVLGENEPMPKERVAPYPYAKVVGTYNSPDGREKDRSLSNAYLRIIENANSYIYIEDQYLVNIDVAKALNKKIKEPNFRKLTFAIQDSIETSDILIPNRKRGEFYSALLNGTTDVEKAKVLMAVIDKTNWEKEHYHPGMHAKTLIVDDEIAIIGSANVNQRSFTVDSETAVVVFDDSAKVDRNFAKVFRTITWKHLLRQPIDRIMYDSWWNYPTTINSGAKGFSILVKYTKDAQDDLDLRIIDIIKQSGVLAAAAAYQISGKDLTVTSTALSPQTIPLIFDTLWENFIDPRGK
jgi:phosphatidylserine/phosphatidylglycerophosphate/cardiolipin synthase-like enzyme